MNDLIGVGLGILSGLLDATKNALFRYSKNKVDPLTFGLYGVFIATLIMLPILLFHGIVILNVNFWYSLIAVTFLDGISSLMYIKAIQISGLSNTVPLITITPIFIVIIEFFILGDIPSKLGFLGIFLIVIGAYLLNFKKKNKNYLEPFKSLMNDKGSKTMLIVSFLFAVVAILYKTGINASDEITFFSFAVFSIFIFYFFIALFKIDWKTFVKARKYFKIFFFTSIIGTIGSLLTTFVMKIIYVSYAISLKRLSVLFSVLIGFLIFKEKNFKEKIIGSIIMVIGVLIIGLYG
ncbi:EamA family transporter [archaeon]|jgi:drug/metabolite transporter (DMT)-like permease|nr:EamA family transporter [archaeon]MBT4646880.1 EamA family transporter [archaeon]MBT6822125.1 EamA family transporter [archaeon]MBT7392614.1 EamA family transporter [archaeon]